MAKLQFRYGAMNSGKTTILIQTAYNYEERNQKVIVLKPLIDTKGDNTIVTRIGLSRKVDERIGENDSIYQKCQKYFSKLSCILVDEAQFLTKEQVDELFIIAKKENIPVIAFGLRTNFKGDAFKGSERLLALADELVEMPTICSCGVKARFNARMINKEFCTVGEEVVIDNGEVEYVSLCGKCFLEKVLKK